MRRTIKLNRMEFQNIYFLGIGGIGMSALARYFLHEGKRVAGYDRTPSHLTDELAAEGAEIHFEDDVRRIPAEFLDPAATMVVYTPGRAAGSRGVSIFRESRVLRREAFADVGTSRRGQVCDGRGGDARQDHDLDARGVAQPRRDGRRKRFSGRNIEELRRQSGAGRGGAAGGRGRRVRPSFLRLYPDVAVITSADADHLDIYGTHER